MGDRLGIPCVVGSFFLAHGDCSRGRIMPSLRTRRGIGCDGNPTVVLSTSLSCLSSACHFFEGFLWSSHSLEFPFLHQCTGSLALLPHLSTGTTKKIKIYTWKYSRYTGSSINGVLSFRKKKACLKCSLFHGHSCIDQFQLWLVPTWVSPVRLGRWRW